MKGKSIFFRRILISLNLGIIIAYLTCCLLPFINTGENPLLAFPGLVFPFIFFSLVFFIILWAILKVKWWWISIIALLLGFQQIITVFAFHFPKKFSSAKNQNTLRVLQWNVTSWDVSSKKENGENSFRIPMLELVNKQNADILCFEEFFEPKDTEYYKSNISSIIKMGFPYYYFVPTKNNESYSQSGIAIFSKYSIIDSANYEFKKNYTGEHLVYADIKINNNIFRIYATHLQPLYLNDPDYQIPNWFKKNQETDASNFYGIFSKLKMGYEFRYIQAEFVSKRINESPYPAIICGDFNELPNSSVYFKVKGNLQDAFLKEGSGFGRTTPFISPTLRIDYIFADKRFKVTQFQILRVPYSDNHYPIETDLQF
ncbi:MAG TPA: endonuclease/exonuclease/phosphatase family protein [Chitinophagaceae bacterium]|nr:endonuclease/exonuclease/phosphatase family protein [Chitinophagaceae bacterium]